MASVANPDSDPLGRILFLLDGVCKTGTGYSALCPGHDDRHPSLSIREGDDQKVLIRCHRGCDFGSVMHALGLPQAAAFPDQRSRSAPSMNGKLAPPRPAPKTPTPRPQKIGERSWEIEPGIVHKRIDYADGSKQVIWLTDGKPGLNGRPLDSLPLYGLADLDPDIKGVIVVEGEPAKDALDPLAAELGLGVVATTTGAATRPNDDVLRLLPHLPIVLWPDADEPGADHMDAIAEALVGIGRQPDYIRRVVWSGARPDSGDDARDFMERGATAADMQRLDTPPYFEGRADREEPEKVSRLNASVPRSPVGHLASEVEPERIVWLSPGRLAAGKCTIVDGDPELGKSTMSLEWAARITRGDALPGGQPSRPRGVVVLSAEDGIADTIVPRLIAAGADRRRIFVMTGIRAAYGDDNIVTLPGGLDAVEAAIDEMDAALVIVDPLMAFLGGDVNSNRDQDVRRAMAPLAALLERTGCAGLLLRHLNKMPGGQAMYRGGGSIGIIGAARIGLLVAVDPDDETAVILAPIKVNIGPHPPALRYRLVGVAGTDVAKVVWDDAPVTFNANSLLAAAADENEERSALDEAKEWIAGLLADGSLPADAVMQQARKDGIAERTLKRAKASLGVKSERDGTVWVWVPPKGVIEGHLSNLGPLGPLGTLGENPRNDAVNQEAQEGQRVQGGQGGQEGQTGKSGTLGPHGPEIDLSGVTVVTPVTRGPPRGCITPKTCVNGVQCWHAQTYGECYGP